MSHPCPISLVAESLSIRQIPLRYPVSDSLARARNCEPVCDQVRAISTCQDSSNLSATGRKPGLRPARQLVTDLVARATEPARELVR